LDLLVLMFIVENPTGEPEHHPRDAKTLSIATFSIMTPRINALGIMTA
jgi:hypothetical protein